MWARLRRRTLAPRKPAVWPQQHAIATVTALVLVASAAFALYVVLA